LIQGATEFLPVSSSGHLAVGNHIIGGLPDSDSAAAFFVVLHAGTLLAVLWVFRKEILSLLRDNLRAIPSLILGTVPAGLAFLLAGDFLKATQGRVTYAGVGFFITSAFLLLSEKGWREEKEFSALRPLDAILVGFAQALAIFPGCSRSGLTISTARVRGVTRPGAATFSFLLSIPAIGGASVVEVTEMGDLFAVATPVAVLTGFLVSFLAGLVSLLLLLRVLRGGRFAYFAPYCIAMGVLALILAVT
jgi:undecaprenyl-diphosphatase